MQHAEQLPLLDEVAGSLREKGSYHKELSEQEVAQIMESVVQNLLAGQGKIKAAIPRPAVHIENEVGTVSGDVRVDAPIKATISVDCVLGNDVTPQRVKLIRSDVQEKAGIAEKLMLKAVNVKRRMNEALQDPNQALGDALESQLLPRGVKLTSTGLHFHERTLAVDLKGEAIK